MLHITEKASVGVLNTTSNTKYLMFFDVVTPIWIIHLGKHNNRIHRKEGYTASISLHSTRTGFDLGPQYP